MPRNSNHEAAAVRSRGIVSRARDQRKEKPARTTIRAGFIRMLVSRRSGGFASAPGTHTESAHRRQAEKTKGCWLWNCADRDCSPGILKRKLDERSRLSTCGGTELEVRPTKIDLAGHFVQEPEADVVVGATEGKRRRAQSFRCRCSEPKVQLPSTMVPNGRLSTRVAEEPPVKLLTTPSFGLAALFAQKLLALPAPRVEIPARR